MDQIVVLNVYRENTFNSITLCRQQPEPDGCRVLGPMIFA